MASKYPEHCEPKTFSQVSTGILWVIEGIMIATILIMFYKTIKKFESKKSPVLYWIGICFQISCIATLSTYLAQSTVYCPYHLYNKNETAYAITAALLNIFLVIHYYLLLVILFIRIHFVFKGSMWAIKQCTIRIYCCLYIAMIVFLLSGSMVFVFHEEDTYGLYLIGIVVVIIIGIMIGLMVLYIRKLINVYKLSEGDQYFMGIITKTTICTLISLSFFFFAYIPFFAVQSMTGYSYWILDLAVITDIYSNYICVIVAYPMFGTYYVKLCGKLDVKCRLCWGRMIGIDINVSQIMHNIKREESKFGIDTTTDHTISGGASTAPPASPSTSISADDKVEMV